MLEKDEQNKIEYNRRRIIFMAKQDANKKDCPKCNKKQWKVVPLHEYGDPFMPSKVLIVCGQCYYEEVFAEAPGDQARSFANKMMKGKDGGPKSVEKGKVDELIIKPNNYGEIKNKKKD